MERRAGVSPHDSYGNPIYFVVQSPILVVDAPHELREGGDDW